MSSRMAKSPRSHRGSTFFEVLIAALILGIGLAATVSLWSFSYRITGQASDKSQGYSLARQTMEQIRETGFFNTPEADIASPNIHYFDGTCTNVDSTPTKAKYKVTSSVVSDLLVSGVSPAKPANGALRTVTVNVTLAADGTSVYSTSTYLARAGI